MDRQMKNMIVGFVVILATFAILISTTLAAAIATTTTTEKDVISAEAVQAILKMNPSSNSVPDMNEIVKMKTVVSSPVLDHDAFILKHHGGSHGSDDQMPCGESCVYIPCFTRVVGCACSEKVCYKGLQTGSKDKMGCLME